MKKEEDDGAGWFLATLALWPVLWTFPAFVAMRLWNWHVVTQWHAAPFAFGHALGVSALVGVVRLKSAAAEEKTSKSLFTGSLGYLFACALYLLLGWWAA